MVVHNAFKYINQTRKLTKNKKTTTRCQVFCGKICLILKGLYGRRWDRDSNFTPLRLTLALWRDPSYIVNEKEKAGLLSCFLVTRGKFAPSCKASDAEAAEQCFELPSRAAKHSGAV